MEIQERPEEATVTLQDQRSHPRHALDEDASILLVEHGLRVAGRVMDLSRGGCRIRAFEHFPVGAGVRVEIVFKARGLVFRVCGVTRWTDGRRQVGILFEEMTDRRRSELFEALGEVEAQNAVKAKQEAARRRAAEEEMAALLRAEAAAASEAAHPDSAGAEIFEASQTDSVTLPAATEPPPDLAAVPSPGSGRGEGRPRKGRIKAARGLQLERPSRSHGEPEVKTPPRERRMLSSLDVDTSAALYLLESSSVVRGRILTLSLNGCRIRTGERFPWQIHTRAEAEFHLQGEPFRLEAVVQSLHDGCNAVIRFLEMSPRKLEQVAQLIEEIEGMRKEKEPEN